MHTRTARTVFSVWIGTSAIVGAWAGDLNPPAGSIGPTMKTLSEVEPRIAINATNTPGDADSMFRISNPGSYYLTGLLLVAPGKMGIEIGSDDVTLDLNGFRIGGIAGTLDGIRVTGLNRRNVTIRNGGVINCQGDGITFRADIYDHWASGCRVEDLTIMNCSGTGLALGLNSIAECVVCVSNGQGGIYSRIACSVIHCTANENGSRGIYMDFNGSVIDCTACDNDGEGIGANGGALIKSCNASGNVEDGISISSEGRVEGCVLRHNEGDGISAGSGNQILANECHFNGYVTGGAAISAYARNRIEGNHCVRSAIGVEVIGPENVVIRNTCTDNALSWSISENNYYGAIINRMGVATPVVSGNSAAGTLGTTDPHANFTH